VTLTRGKREASKAAGQRTLIVPSLVRKLPMATPFGFVRLSPLATYQSRYALLPVVGASPSISSRTS
jgi:hypothetical protein